MSVQALTSHSVRASIGCTATQRLLLPAQSRPMSSSKATADSSRPSTSSHTQSTRPRRHVCSSIKQHTQRRNASNAAPAPTTPAPSSSPASATTTAQTQLTWNDFFRLRQRRRYFNLSSSLLLSSSSFATGISFISQQSPETMQFFGMDPLVGMVASSLGCLGTGWLAGPLVGNAFFRLFYSASGGMAVKERDFYNRIKRYRIDPSSSSMQNPVPDYYGEKITSVSGYRQWLKDQRAFNKKRQSFL